MTLKDTNELYADTVTAIPAEAWHILGVEGTRKLSVECPLCLEFNILTEHHVGGDGIIEPAFICPYDGCGFHNNVRLEGWC